MFDCNFTYICVLIPSKPKLCSIFCCPNCFHFDLLSPGFSSGFETYDLLQGDVSPSLNFQPGGPGLCLYDPGDKVAPFYPPGIW